MTTQDSTSQTQLPVRMLHDRILVEPDEGATERRSASGIVIPATAAMGKRLAWAKVVAVGPSVRQVKLEDTILYDPEDRHEVEIDAKTYVLVRERDLHAVADPHGPQQTQGMYL